MLGKLLYHPHSFDAKLPQGEGPDRLILVYQDSGC